MLDKSTAIALAHEVFDKELDAIAKTRNALGDDFITLLELVLSCRGKVIFTGMGKPGHIARKLSATMASLGTPSFALHPAEALHGDLGMVDAKDVVILMSYSGESDEITRLMPTLHEIGCETVAITGNKQSSLAKECAHHFFFPKFEEACFMGLAPTSSTTALLVLGDALSLVASRMKSYTREDYGIHHPAGALGKKLLLHVSDIMHAGEENAVVVLGCPLLDAIVQMSSKGLSLVNVVDSQQQLMGIITDGDLRRMLERHVDVYNEIIDHVMTSNPKHIQEKELAVNALQKMTDHNITGLPVVNQNNTLVGTILMQDIYKAGIVK